MTSICEELTLYFSGDIPIFLVSLPLNWKDEIKIWQKQTAQHDHQVDLISKVKNGNFGNFNFSNIAVFEFSYLILLEK